MLAGEIGDAIVTWGRRLTARLDGLTDAEYLWEPVEGCWSIQEAPDGLWSPDLGPAGNTWTPVVPPPVTTIAWRMRHLGASPSPTWPPTSTPTPRALADAWFSQDRQDTAAAFGTSAEGVDALGAHWNVFGEQVASYPDDELLQPIGDIGGAFGSTSILGLVMHMADELIHHSAEIGVLRDLYRSGFLVP
jgi:hypothetical protein